MRILLVFLISYASFYAALAQDKPAELPPSKPAEASSKPAINKDFDLAKMVPLFFRVQDSNFKLSAPFVSYDLQSSNGVSLKIGPLVFSDKSIQVSVKEGRLFLKWDSLLSAGSEVIIYGAEGDKIWESPIFGEGEWLGPKMTSDEAPKIEANERVRFCVMSQQLKSYSNLCSAWLGLQVTKADQAFEPLNVISQPRVFINKEESKLIGNPKADPDAVFSFLASLKSGANYEFNTEPEIPVFRDLILTEDEKDILLTGEMPAPLNFGKVKIIPLETSDFTKPRDPAGTLIKVEDLWEVQISKDTKLISFPGRVGGIFNFNVKVSNPPKAKERRYISQRSLSGSYLEKDRTLVFDQQGKSIDWEFSMAKELELNRAYLNVPGTGVTHQAYSDFYRMAGREASLRLTGIYSSQGGTAFFAEGHVSWWFNDLFGWQDYYFSKQRWGVSAKYFTSIIPIPALIDGSNIREISISVIDMDLRYRVMPGLWERDEAVGLILSHESTQIGELSVPKIGFGAFWARSMPKIFDDIFSLLPYMDYPKWVDMEFISYTMSSDARYELGKSDYVLNFHGKVLWTPRIFGEAGFGIKSYNFESPADSSGLKMTALYGTVGLGYNF